MVMVNRVKVPVLETQIVRRMLQIIIYFLSIRALEHNVRQLLLVLDVVIYIRPCMC